MTFAETKWLTNSKKLESYQDILHDSKVGIVTSILSDIQNVFLLKRVKNEKKKLQNSFWMLEPPTIDHFTTIEILYWTYLELFRSVVEFGGFRVKFWELARRICFLFSSCWVLFWSNELNGYKDKDVLRWTNESGSRFFNTIGLNVDVIQTKQWEEFPSKIAEFQNNWNSFSSTYQVNWDSFSWTFLLSED